tara:strand:+ start:303 stop:911 length:609 start_codon:yes stop_codon:yes gene_type:complete
MERALKERIIGAIFLVAFVVLVVPVFLDGPPKNSITISKRILLPGQEQQDLKTVVLERERLDPIPSAQSSDLVENKSAISTSDESNNSSLNSKIQNKPDQILVNQKKDGIDQEYQTKLAQNSQSSTGMWTVQLGSFSNKESADNLYTDLRKQGYAVFMSTFQANSGLFYRVRIGPQKNKNDAEIMAINLLKAGHKGEVLPYP